MDETRRVGRTRTSIQIRTGMAASRMEMEPLQVLQTKLDPFRIADRPPRTQDSFARLKPWSRTWFCVQGGRLWTTHAASCRSLGSAGCGSCLPSQYRKGNALQLLLDALQRGLRPDLHACAAISCTDAPQLPRSKPRHLVLSYSSSCAQASPIEQSWDVPFVDYSMPLRWPRWLESLRHDAPPAWNHKLDLGVVAFANYSEFYRGFSNGNVSPNRMKLRHAFYHGCTGFERRHDWTGTLEIVNGLQSERNRIFKTELCRYRYIILMSGNSNWLDSFKELLWCGSLIIFVADVGSHMTPLLRHACDAVMHSLVNGTHYLRFDVDAGTLDPRNNGTARHDLCRLVHSAVAWAQANQDEARAIAKRGQSLVRRTWDLDGVYGYVNATLEALDAMQSVAMVNDTIHALRGEPIVNVSQTMNAHPGRWLIKR